MSSLGGSQDLLTRASSKDRVSYGNHDFWFPPLSNFFLKKIREPRREAASAGRCWEFSLCVSINGINTRLVVGTQEGGGADRQGSGW